MSNYTSFLTSKESKVTPSGFKVDASDLHPALFDFQRAIVARAIAQGKFCNGADTGLGKSLMSMAWAHMVCTHTNLPVLILAPLAVSHQFVREGQKFNIEVTFIESQDDVQGAKIYTSNYEKLQKFNPSCFSGIVLDEGSILKNLDGKTSRAILSNFGDTPFKLSASATFAPNDIPEIGMQSEFVGAMKESEMKAQFFIHEQKDGVGGTHWRLKKHAPEKFWGWLSSWCALTRKPSDVGMYSDEDYILPGLNEFDHEIDSQIESPAEILQGMWIPSGSASDKRHVNKQSLEQRCKEAANLANNSSDQWVLWCNSNAESELLSAYIPDAVEVAGKHKDDYKIEAITKFQQGIIRVIVTKDKIFGFGINLQNCFNTVVFPNDSYERYYQLVRRFYRFGQTNAVNVHRVYHRLEGYSTVPNLQRKAEQACYMFEQMKPFQVKQFQSLHSKTLRLSTPYNPQSRMVIPNWLKSVA